MELDSINHESRLYVIKAGAGFSCYGFDVAERKRAAVLQWITGAPVAPMATGTAEHFAAFNDAMAAGAAHNRATGKRCLAELESELVGREGKRVEIIAPGEPRRRFYVGRSMGWMPCHLEIARRDSTGGPAAYIPSGALVRTVYQ